MVVGDVETSPEATNLRGGRGTVSMRVPQQAPVGSAQVQFRCDGEWSNAVELAVEP